MKSILGRGLILIALIMFLAMSVAASVAFADGPTRLSVWDELDTYVIVHPHSTTAASKSTLVTHVSTDDIDPNFHRIVGFSVGEHDAAKSGERMIALYDGTDKSYLTDNTYLFDEAEAEDNVTFERWYAYPKRLAAGLTFAQGVNTIAVIFYEDMRGK